MTKMAAFLNIVKPIHWIYQSSALGRPDIDQYLWYSRSFLPLSGRQLPPLAAFTR